MCSGRKKYYCAWLQMKERKRLEMLGEWNSPGLLTPREEFRAGLYVSLASGEKEDCLVKYKPFSHSCYFYWDLTETLEFLHILVDFFTPFFFSNFIMKDHLVFPICLAPLIVVRNIVCWLFESPQPWSLQTVGPRINLRAWLCQSFYRMCATQHTKFGTY